MGKAGRFACIFVPMGLTVASLICLLLVFLGGLNKNSALQRDIYFFKADTSEFKSNPDIIQGSNIDDKLLEYFKASNNGKILKDFYTVGIWNYCEGDKDSNGKETITYCSPRKASFWFDPTAVWGFNGTDVNSVLGNKLSDGLNLYSKIVKWMFTAYTIAFWTTAATIVVGIFAIFSRWGSFITTIVASAAAIFALAASATATGVYGVLTGTFNTALKPYKIKGHLGQRMMGITWLAVAFGIGACLFWLISVCCCSGKSKEKKTVKVEKTPYTYERVESPYMGGSSNVPLQTMGTTYGNTYTKQSAYEPFRHHGDNKV